MPTIQSFSASFIATNCSLLGAGQKSNAFPLNHISMSSTWHVFGFWNITTMSCNKKCFRLPIPCSSQESIIMASEQANARIFHCLKNNTHVFFTLLRMAICGSHSSSLWHQILPLLADCHNSLTDWYFLYPPKRLYFQPEDYPHCFPAFGQMTPEVIRNCQKHVTD